MTKYAHHILVLTNMRPTIEKPFIGKFVEDQVKQLRKTSKYLISYFNMPRTKFSKLKYLVFLYRFMKFSTNKRFDLIHVHFYFPTVIAAIFYKLIFNHGTKIVVTFHGSDIFLYDRTNRVYVYLLRYIDQAIFVSNGLQVQFENKFGNVDIKKVVLCAGVHDIYYENSSPSFCSKKYDLIFIGTLDENKGTKRLHTILNASTKSLKILVVGKGDAESLLKSSYNADHEITLLGSLDKPNVVQAIQSAKYLLNLSYNESFGLAMAEALALGTPVIATKTDGSKEQIQPNHNGFLIPQDTPFFTLNCIEVIERALSIGPTEYLSLSKQARVNCERYSLKSVCHKINEIYENQL